MILLTRRKRVLEATAAEARRQGITIDRARQALANRDEAAAIAERRYIEAWVDAENAARVLEALVEDGGVAVNAPT